MKKIVDVENLPKGGPYSHAVINDGLIFVSGQSGQTGSNKKIFKEQFESTINKIQLILERSSSSLKNVLKVSIYLSSKEYFSEMNKLFNKYFPENPPARTTLVTSFIDENILVEVDVIASK
jgi:2-iminobutanoate/2-iminopropanoate deaminase